MKKKLDKSHLSAYIVYRADGASNFGHREIPALRFRPWQDDVKLPRGRCDVSAAARCEAVLGRDVKPAPFIGEKCELFHQEELR